MGYVSKGIIWSGVERLSSQFIQFILNIIIARILSPEDYGMIGMLTIFLQICQCLIDGGFSNALIQKTNRTDIDYGTVFSFNITISVLLYLFLFAASPYIASFYGIAQLSSLLRVLGINLIVISLFTVQKTILTINVDFKKQSYASITSGIISGIIGIAAAYNGFGVWSLVIQTLVNSIITCVIFWIISIYNVNIRFCFSKKSFYELGGYGVKLMSASLLHTIYINLYSLVIGKVYSANELGFYTRADQFVSYASSNISSIISRVSFPVLCQKRDIKSNLAISYEQFIKFSCFVIFPIMIFMAFLSKPIIIVLLTHKWLATAPFLVILCIDGLWSPINNINLSLLQAVGRSDLFLRLEIYKKIIAVIILFITLPFGIKAICFGRVFYGLLALVINMRYTQNIINKSVLSQFSCWIKILLIALLSGLCVYCIKIFIISPLLQLTVGLTVGFAIYLILIKTFNIVEFRTLLKT